MRLLLSCATAVLVAATICCCPNPAPERRGAGPFRAAARVRLRQEPQADPRLSQARGLRSPERPALPVRLPQLSAHRDPRRAQGRPRDGAREGHGPDPGVCGRLVLAVLAHRAQQRAGRPGDRDPAGHRQEARLGRGHRLGQHRHALRRWGHLRHLGRQGHLRHLPGPHRHQRRSPHASAQDGLHRSRS